MDLCSKEHPVCFTYGRVHDPKNAKYHRHMHSEYEILLFLVEGPYYVIDGTKYPMKANTLLLVPTQTYHFAMPENAAYYCRYMLAFKADAVDARLLQEAFPGRNRFDLDKQHPIVQNFHHLNDLLQTTPEEHRDLLLRTFCTQVLLDLLALRREFPDNSKAQADPILTYIDRHLTTIRSADEIAEHFFISTSALSHQFRERMDISLMKYIRQKRLLLAKSLLEQGEKAMDVYLQCGFREYTAFYKAYVRFFGIPPSQTE